MTGFTAIETIYKDMGIQGQAQMNGIRDDILRLTKETQQCQSHATVQTARLESLRTKLEVLQQEQSACTRHIGVLKSLYYQEISRRWDQIAEADKRSNEWIFDRTRTSFATWLASKEQNDTIYYVTGKVSCNHSSETVDAEQYRLAVGNPHL
jgi:predicted nuclease with TOPRIM domain